MISRTNYLTKFQDNLLQIKEIFLSLFPRNRSEILLFLGLLAFYFSYSIFFLLNSHVVDDPNHNYDTLFAFDNCIAFHKGVTGKDTHPLMSFFTYPFLLFAAKLGAVLGYKYTGLVVVICLSAFVSLGVVYVHRYMKEIVALPSAIVWLLTIIYAGFFTNLILCFIIESYTLSIFLLPFTVFCYSYYLQKKKNIRLLSLILFTIVIGGITITNALKTTFSYLFTFGNFKVKLKKAFIVGLIFVLATYLGLLLTLGENELWGLIQFRIRCADSTLTSAIMPYYRNVIDLFLGSPIFSSEPLKMLYDEGRFAVLGATEAFAKAATGRPVIVIDFYRHWWQYLWLALFYLLIITSIIRNYKNKLVLLLLSFWFIDIFIHIVVGYGIGEGFIYAGHWIFLMPMFLAWGYKSLKNRSQKIYLVGISVLGIVMIINNLIRLAQTYSIAVEYFPPIIPSF